MKALVLTEDGPRLMEASLPQLGPEDVLIAVKAAALNRADIYMARGLKHGAAGGVGQVLGGDCAGEIVAVGDAVQGIELGQRVMDPGFGAFAQFKSAPARRILPMPDNLSFEEAACLPVALMTMHDAVMTRGKLQPGQSVLVQGASTGVGLFAMQIARLRGASLVIGSSTNAERRALLSGFGANMAIDTKNEAWPDAVLAATDGKGVDLIIDQLAGPLVNANFAATRVGGVIVNVGRLAGARSEIDIDLHALRRITYIGVTFRTRTGREVAEAVQLMRDDLWPDVAAGRFRIPIDRAYPLAEADEAYKRMRRNEHFGKILLLP